jgi:hypothetical protein
LANNCEHEKNLEILLIAFIEKAFKDIFPSVFARHLIFNEYLPLEKRRDLMPTYRFKAPFTLT